MTYAKLSQAIEANEHGFYKILSMSVEEDQRREQEWSIAYNIWIDLYKRMAGKQYEQGDSELVTEILDEKSKSLDPAKLTMGEARVFKLLTMSAKATAWHPYLAPMLDQHDEVVIGLFMVYLPQEQRLSRVDLR
jgi:hypothetical protein